jgi:hypothetical protein
MNQAMKQAGRRSGLQGDVLALYRNLLRSAKLKKDIGVVNHVRQKFREDAMSIKRIEFKQIEHMLRLGHKKLKLLNLPGTKLVGFNDTAPTSTPHRSYSTRPNNFEAPSRLRAHIVSLGCGRNWVDSEVNDKDNLFRMHTCLSMYVRALLAMFGFDNVVTVCVCVCVCV